MSKQDMEVKTPGTQVAGLKVAFTSVIMAASLLFDVYVMVNHAKLVWLTGVASLVFLVAVYFFVNSILVLKYTSQVREEEMYDDLFKSSKATYLMMKKYFDEVEEMLDEMNEKAGIPQEEIINAQKSIAKVTISRNKENADALMNSNDKLLDKIFDFEDELAKIESKIDSSKKGISEEKLQEVSMKQLELANLIKELEVSLKKEILSINTKIQNQPAPVMMAPTMMPGYMPNMQVEAPSMKEGISEEKLDSLVEKANEELNKEMAEFNTEEIPQGEVISFEQEKDSSEDIMMDDLGLDLGLDLGVDLEENSDVPLEELSLDDLSVDSLLEGLTDVKSEETVTEEPLMEEAVVEEPLIEEPLVEEAVVEEPLIEEPLMEEAVVEEPVIEEPLVEEAVVEEPVIEEPVVEVEKPPMPDLSDPNHVMTPDEIAALLANTESEALVEPEPEPEPEPVPEPEPAPVAEEPAAEAPPMPDLSDPNHVMTPDEIAALLANM